jgi:hypothetical protein
MWVVGTMAVAGAIGSAIGTNRQVDNQIKALEAKEKALRAQGVQTKGLFHKKSAQAQIFGDYEETRIKRIQAFKTSQKTASMGGKGASIGAGGTPWNVILSQKAEDTKNISLHKYKIKTQTDNLKEEGQRQYDSFMNQAENAYDQKQQLHSQRGEMLWTSLLTGGIQGGSAGASMSSSYHSMNPGTSGGGGGGAGSNTTGGSAGSGIVILRYKFQN